MRGTTYVSTSFRTGFPRTFIKRRGNAAPTLLFVVLTKVHPWGGDEKKTKLLNQQHIELIIKPL